jgi:glycosyltransferase involved in cell wall biosynthesis
MIGSAYFEKVLAKKIPLLYDFDDAIWIPAVSEGNRKLSFLKNFDKPREIIKVAQLIFAGNSYLANYARQYNSNVWIVPTTVDTDRFSKDESRNKEKLCIGWTGTFSTLAHFETVLDALYIIQEKYRERVYFKLIGVPSYRNDRLGIQGVVWTSETEIEELSALEGKCGLKGLTYMSLGMATIMSPVGVNKEIIRDGENGYLAASLEEWVEKMSLLIEDERLRFELGQEARKTVLEKYSVISQRNQYLSAFNQLTDGKI